MEVHPYPPASQGEASLLAQAEDWSPSEVEEKASYLLETARTALVTSGSSHEVKLDCIRWMADRLLGFVPVFELEDTLLYPLLCAVLEYLEEVLSMLVETTEENRVHLLSLVCTLVEHTERVVRHCMEQECGVGEVPSLPRVLPKILITTFSYLGRGEIIATTDLLKAELANCFSKSRNLLALFLGLVEEKKIRTVLEDELDILVSLCSELVSFHQVLIPLDFKLTCMVWRVYVKLTSTHKTRLVDRLDLTLATEVISSELCGQMAKFRQMLENSKDEGTGKLMAKVVYLLKLLISLGSTTACVGECPSFLGLLLEMVSGLPSLPPWIQEAHRQKIVNEVISVSVKHSLLNMAATQSFIDFLLHFFTPSHSVKQLLLAKPFLSLQLVVKLLLLQPGQEDQLLLLCFHLLSSAGFCLEQRQSLEGRQIMGKSITMVDNYTWVLINLCSWVSSISPDQFSMVEKVLISTLLNPSSSPLTCMMVSDIWCFLARYGTSQLCLAHLTLLSSIRLKLKQSSFSIPLLMTNLLMDRLTNFLSPSDLSTWQSHTEPRSDLDQLPTLSSAAAARCFLLAARTNLDMLAVVVRDTWRRLVEGAYRPAERLTSLRLVMALTEATLVVVDSLSTKDLVCLLEHMGTVARVGQYKKQFLLVCLLKVVRVVARTEDVQLREQLVGLVRIVASRYEVRQGESSLGLLAIMATGEVKVELGDKLDRMRQEEELQGEDIEKLLGGVWTVGESERMVRLVNCQQEEIMRKVSPTSSCDLSVSMKKRKLSPSKDGFELCLTKLEREVDTLTALVEEEERGKRTDKKERLDEVARKIQVVLHRL